MCTKNFEKSVGKPAPRRERVKDFLEPDQWPMTKRKCVKLNYTEFEFHNKIKNLDFKNTPGFTISKNMNSELLHGGIHAGIHLVDPTESTLNVSNFVEF